jgi:hypothetical protein
MRLLPGPALSTKLMYQSRPKRKRGLEAYTQFEGRQLFYQTTMPELDE